MSSALSGQLSLDTKARIFVVATVILITVLSSIILLHFNFFSSKLSKTRDTTIPTLLYSTILTQQGTWLRDQMDQAIATDNPLIQDSILITIQSYTTYKSTLEELRLIQTSPDLLKELENEFSLLQHHTIATITAKKTLLEQEEHIENISIRLYTLLAKIAHYPKESLIDQKLADVTLLTISDMLSIAQEAEPWIVNTMGTAVLEKISQGQKLEDFASQQISAIFNETNRLLTSQTGLIERKKMALSARKKFTNLHARASFIGTNIVQSCAVLRQSAESNLQTTQEETINRFTLVEKTTFGFLIFLLIFFIGVYFFLQKNILSPILSLRSAIQNVTASIKIGEHQTSALPLKGELEIQEISQSTMYFLQEITSQREELEQSHNHLEEEVRKRTLHITTLSGKIIQAQETEGRRIAAELHDDIGATLSVIKMGLEHNTRLIEKAQLPPQELWSNLVKQKDLITHVTSQLRQIQTDLSPPYLALGLREGLGVLCEDYIMLHDNITFDYAFHAKGSDISEVLHIVIYRILQEGLTNIIKHSECTKARIGLFLRDGVLTFSIEDNGVPFSDSLSPGMGLQNIEERVLITNGTLTYQTDAPWKGVIITWNISSLSS